MAIYRNVHISFWDDAKVQDEFTPEDRYFMFWLLSNPKTNLSGCYEISYKKAENEIGYTEAIVKALLLRFEEVHKIVMFDENTKEVLVKNWYRYNWTKSSKLDKPIFDFIVKIKSDRLRNYIGRVFLKRDLEQAMSDEMIGYLYPMDTTDTVTDTDSVPEPVYKKPKKRTVKTKKKHLDCIALTDDEHKKLQEKFIDYEERMQKLNDYKMSKGKKYQSDYHTILAWSRNDKKKNDVEVPADFNENIQKKTPKKEEEKRIKEMLSRY